MPLKYSLEMGSSLRLKRKNEIPDDNSTSIVIAGDWAPGLGELTATLKQVGRQYFEDILAEFHKSDLCVVNIETVLDDHSQPSPKGATQIITEPSLANLLNDLNIGLACLANNHIMDNGPSGLEKTVNYLNKIGIPTIGAGLTYKDIYKPFIYEANNIQIALFNLAEGEEACEKNNNGVGAAYIESFRFWDQFRKYKKLGYYTIVICHAGIEFLPTPPPYIKQLFRTLVDEGADLIVAHHPHVPQGFEIYKDKPIFYSLGNFVTWREDRRFYEYRSYSIRLKISVNQLSSVEFIPYTIDRLRIGDWPLDDFEVLLRELNYLLEHESHTIWKGYLCRHSVEARYLKQLASWPFNSELLKSSQVNYHTSLSQKYIHIDSFSSNLETNDEVEEILDRWGVTTKEPSFKWVMHFLENRFAIFSTWLIKIKRLLRYMKKCFPT